MKRLVNCKKRTQKILIVIVTMLIFNFIMPNYSQADFGGLLLKPFTDMFAGLGDAICALLQLCMYDGSFFEGKGFLNGFLVTSEGFDAAKYDMTYTGDDPNNKVDVHKFWLENMDQEGFDLIGPGSGKIAIPVTRYTPDFIFSGKVPALDINFISPNDWEGNSEKQERSPAYQLHGTIAEWYVALRNLAAVFLMVILVYVGIRIIISSTASDKAKYKQMLMDWLVAMCLLFCLHYIMSFTITITQEITNAISGSSTNSANTIPVYIKHGGNDVVKFNTNLTGLCRIHTKANDGGEKLVYTILYLALVFYTCMFTFTYLKRVITMAFLTLIAPLVAITYPIDKMNDGKAQAFNMWLKEYIFNALLQPFHLIIYTVLVTSAMNLASTNIIYAIVALAFITPAEKMLRKFFGFDKNSSTAGTLGAFANMAGGAAFMKAAKGLMAPKKGGGASGGKGIKTNGGVKGSTPSLADAYGNGSGGKSEDNSGTPALESTTKDAGNTSTQAGDGTVVTAGPEGTQARFVPPYQPDENGRFPSAGHQTKSTSNSSGQHLSGNSFAYSDEDGRGIGQWIGDGIRNSKAGRAAKNKYTAAKGTIRKFANENKLGRGLTGKWIPKPIRNSARGALNVVGKTGLAVGKAALKAAPGAMLGLAAGIAGDDLGDIAKYTVAGAALSSTIGSSSLAQAGSFVTDAYNQGAHGSVEGQLEQRRRAFERDESNELLAKSMFPDASNSEIKTKMRQASYYDSLGIEGKDAFKAAKLEDDLREKLAGEGRAEEDAAKLAQKQAAVIADIAKDYSKKDLRDRDEVMNLRNDLSSKLGGAGLKGTELSSQVESLVSEIKAFKGVRNNY